MALLKDLTGIGSIADLGGKIIDKLFPDPAAAASAKLNLVKLQQDGEFKDLDNQLALSQMQADTNKIEAASGSTFVSGWRPAIGWVCALAMFCQFIGSPALAWLSSLVGVPVPPVQADWTQFTPILMGMLGLGAMRTYEKVQGVASK